MARTQGSQNKPKEVLYTHTCKNCTFVAKTSIPNVQIGHVCTDYSAKKKGK